MKLPEQAVREFQAAWQASFGEEIAYEEAEAKGRNLIQIHDELIRIALRRSQKVTK